MALRWIFGLFSKENIKSFSPLKEDGDAFYRNNNFKESIRMYSLALKLDPSSFTVLANRSASYLQLGKVSCAIADANACIKLSPRYVKGYIRKGEALSKNRQFDAAVTAYKHGLLLAPTNYSILEGIRWCTLKGNQAKSIRKSRIEWSVLIIILSILAYLCYPPIPLENCSYSSVVDDTPEYKQMGEDPLSLYFNSNFSRLRGVSIDKTNSAIMLLGDQEASNEVEFPGKLKLSDFATALLMAHENPSFEISYSLDELDPKENEYKDFYKKVFYPDASKSKYFQYSTLGFAIHDADWFIKVLVNDIQNRISSYRFGTYKSLFDRRIQYPKHNLLSSSSSVRLWWTVGVTSLRVESVASNNIHRLWINDEDIDIHLQAHSIENDKTGKRVDAEENHLDPELISFIAWVNANIKDIIAIVPEMFRLREVFVAVEVAKFIVSVLPAAQIDLNTLNKLFHQVEPLVTRDNGNYTVSKCKGMIKKTISIGNVETTHSSSVVGGVRFSSSSPQTPRAAFPSQFSIVLQRAGPQSSGYSGVSLLSVDGVPSRYHGAYHGLVWQLKEFGRHSHHVIPNCATTISRWFGPAIEMEAKDHMSLPSSRNDRSLFQSYKSLWDSGRYRDALYQGIKEVNSMFPGRYESALNDMTRYIHDSKKKVFEWYHY